MSRLARLVFVCCLSLCVTGWALEDAEIPTDPPQDEIMPAERQVQEVLDWASLAFTGRRMGVEPAIRVEVKRQDHSVLQFGRSCIETPIRIGQQEFAHGLGTHANSEIVLHVPAGARAFEAFAGIDNNSDTGGARGYRAVQRRNRRSQRVPDPCSQRRPGSGCGARRSAGRDAGSDAQGGYDAGWAGLRSGRLG